MLFANFTLAQEVNENESEIKIITEKTTTTMNITSELNKEIKEQQPIQTEVNSKELGEYHNEIITTQKSDEIGNKLAEYWYDHEGNRIKKIEFRGGNILDNETTYYPFKEWVQVRNSSGVFNYTYYYMNDKLVAHKAPDGKKYFYHPDHLGSTTLITNESGSVVEDIAYLPYGVVYSGPTASRYLFTGKELDKETALKYYGARYYDPEFRISLN